MNIKTLSQRSAFLLLIAVPLFLMALGSGREPARRIVIPATLHNGKSDFVGRGISSLANEITMVRLETRPKALNGHHR